MPFVNADILAKQLYPLSPELHSYEAAQIAVEIRTQLLQQGECFCYETVFSHPSKIDLVANAKAQGYEVILVFIHLDMIQLNLARITQRVNEGGHHVPEEKVINRIPRLLKYIKRTLPLCDYVYILNNSRRDNPFQSIAILKKGQLTLLKKPLDTWVKELLLDYLEDKK